MWQSSSVEGLLRGCSPPPLIDRGSGGAAIAAAPAGARAPNSSAGVTSQGWFSRCILSVRPLNGASCGVTLCHCSWQRCSDVGSSVVPFENYHLH